MRRPALAAVSVDALPDIDGSSPGLWCLSTQNATRYLVRAVPEGRHRAIRISWYGMHGDWRGYFRSHVYTGDRYPADPEPVRVGEPMLIRFSALDYDNYRSGPIVEILRFDLPDALRLEEIEAAAHEAMIDAAHDVLAEAYAAGRIESEEALREVLEGRGLDVAEVLRRLT